MSSQSGPLPTVSNDKPKAIQAPEEWRRLALSVRPGGPRLFSISLFAPRTASHIAAQGTDCAHLRQPPPPPAWSHPQ